MRPSQSVSHARAAVLAAGAVVVWRVLAHLEPSSLIEQAPGFAIPLAAVGLAFVVAGLIVRLMRPGSVVGLYLTWCLCSGVHWGGAVGAGSASIELSLLLVYLGLSAAGAAALFQLALSYPSAPQTPRWILRSLYVPSVAGVLAAPIAGALPTGLLRAVAGIVLLAGNALGLGAGVIFIVRFLRADRRARRRNSLDVVVASLLIAGVPSLLAAFGLLPGPSDAYNLLTVFAPAGLGYALLRRAGTDRTPHRHGVPWAADRR